MLTPGSSVGLSLQDVTIADLLKSVGYATAAIGKCHLGDDKTFMPTRQGFDHYFGLPYSNDMSPLPLQEIVSAMDLLPTLAGITGAQLPSWTIDGRNILPILIGRPEAASPRDALYFYDGTMLQAVRSGPWKLHLPHGYWTITQPGADGQAGQKETRDLPLSLFNLDQDPGETVNLADQYPDVVRRLREAALAFDTDVKNNQRPIGQICADPSLCGPGNWPQSAGRQPIRVVLDPEERPVGKGVLCGQTQGFNLQAATRVSEHDKAGRERLSRYILLPPLANERLSILDNRNVRPEFKRP